MLSKKNPVHDVLKRYGHLVGSVWEGARLNKLEDDFSNYLTTRAPPPPINFSTSVTDAMDVSPGVVIASAPWAAP